MNATYYAAQAQKNAEQAAQHLAMGNLELGIAHLRAAQTFADQYKAAVHTDPDTYLYGVDNPALTIGALNSVALAHRRIADQYLRQRDTPAAETHYTAAAIFREERAHLDTRLAFTQGANA